jgi:hypothetical protein
MRRFFRDPIGGISQHVTVLILPGGSGPRCEAAQFRLDSHGVSISGSPGRSASLDILSAFSSTIVDSDVRGGLNRRILEVISKVCVVRGTFGGMQNY